MSFPDELSPSMVDLARTAVRALNCDILSFTRAGATKETTVLVPNGLSDADSQTIARCSERWLDQYPWSTDPGTQQVSVDDGSVPPASSIPGMRVGLVTPIRQDGALVGILAALRDAPVFSPEERSLADAFARHFGIALAPRAPAASRYLNGLLEALDEINRRAVSVTRIDELSAMLDPVLASVFGQVRSGLALWNETQGVLEMVSSTFPVDMWQTTLSDLRSSTVRVFLTGTSWVTDQALTDPGVLHDQPLRFQVERLVQIQLTAGGRRIGVLSIAMEDHPSLELLEMIERLAPHLATVVEFARTAARLRRHGDLTAAVSSIAVAIAGADKASRDCELVRGLHDLRRAIGGCALVIERDGSDDLVDADPDVTDYVSRVLTSLGGADGCVERPVDGSAGFEGWLLSVPILLSDEHIGTLVAMKSARFNADERSSLERVANLVALQASSDRHWHQRIQLATVHERERLANDLHDDVVQLLYGVQLNLDLAIEAAAESVDDERLLRSRELAVSADRVLRQMIHDRSDPMTPELGLGVRDIVDQMRREHGLDVALVLPGEPLDLQTPVTQLLLRVVRECLTNVAKHAGSDHVQVEVRASNGNVEVTISDDGAGVVNRAQGTEGYGLGSLRRSLARHGGQLLVSSTADGTVVAAQLALP